MHAYNFFEVITGSQYLSVLFRFELTFVVNTSYGKKDNKQTCLLRAPRHVANSNSRYYL